MHTIHTHHNVRIVHQWIEEICGLYKRQITMSKRNNWRVQANSCQQSRLLIGYHW